MNVLQQVSKSQPDGAMFERRSDRWRVVLCSMIVSVLISFQMFKPATSSGEIAIGLALATVTCLLMILSGSLDDCKRILTVSNPRPWSQRRGEICLHLAYVMMLCISLYCLLTLELSLAQNTLGILAMFSLAMAMSCLRSWYSVARTLKEQRAKWRLYEASIGPWPGGSC